MATQTEQWVADWLAPFLQSVQAMLSFPDTPRLACLVLHTGHIVFHRDGFWSVSDPEEPPDRTAQKLRGLIAVTAQFDAAG
jgi:hypothetical protein